ncbi:hypothetical protein E2C01_065127 [Portunus trituberculatus]|uniref:Uncharacterized protein n=1 Tax=Portunus trituberculatus TaxID=210409 RepID=A0A5B7HLP7_PORTR|nr:hypothetical protein [Portunus trituberculatus]
MFQRALCHVKMAQRNDTLSYLCPIPAGLASVSLAVMGGGHAPRPPHDSDTPFEALWCDGRSDTVW